MRLDFEWIADMLAELDVLVSAATLRRSEVRGRLVYDAAMAARRNGGTGDGALEPIATYFAGMLSDAGCPRGWLEEALRRMEARQVSDAYLWARPMEGAREAMDALLAGGVRLACISNSDGRAEAHLERYGLREGLEFVVDSAVVGVEKPDPRIFALALGRLGVAPERALYVGDFRSIDERGALAAGMHSVLLDPWGTYARGGTGTVASPRELPAYVEHRFAITPPARSPGRS